MASELAHYRSQISTLLDHIDQQRLEPGYYDMLASGIRWVRMNVEELTLAEVVPRLATRYPEAFDDGERILSQLASADADLDREDVQALETLVYERLLRLL